MDIFEKLNLCEGRKGRGRGGGEGGGGLKCITWTVVHNLCQIIILFPASKNVNKADYL